MVFEYQLVVVGIRLGVAEDESGGLFVGGVAEGSVLAGYGDVGGLAPEVLRGLDTTHHVVYQLAAVAAVHLDGQAQLLADRLQGAVYKVLQCRDVALQRDVWYWRLM